MVSPITSPITAASRALEGILSDQTIKIDWKDANGKTLKTLSFDTIEQFEFSEESSVASLPLEKGSFASYNKLNTPKRLQLRCLKAGDFGQISLMVSDLDRMVQNADLAMITTPWEIYESYTLRSFNYGRNAREGCSILVADLSFEEIRQVETTEQSIKLGGAKKPAATDTVQAGTKRGQSFVSQSLDVGKNLGTRVSNFVGEKYDSVMNWAKKLGGNL